MTQYLIPTEKAYRYLAMLEEQEKARSEMPYRETPEGWESRDTVVNRVEIYLDWWDRIKVLFGSRLTVHSEIRTENPVGRIRSESEAIVTSWAFWRRWRRPQPQGMISDGQPPDRSDG